MKNLARRRLEQRHGKNVREDADKQKHERVDGTGSDLIGQHGSPCLVTVHQEHVACNEHYS